MRIPSGRLVLFTALLAFATGCSDSTTDGSAPPSGTPDVARITCEADGSTTVETPNVLVQRDGVHIRVINRMDETVSLNGLGFDADPGTSSWVAGHPGRTEVACWPFSDHTKEPPATTPLTVYDPRHRYVSSDLECTAEDDGSALDIHLVPSDDGKEAASITPAEVRPLIGGLLPDDEVVLPGFVDAIHHSVVVIRDGRRIASVGFAFIDGRWAQRGGHVCGGSTVTA